MAVDRHAFLLLTAACSFVSVLCDTWSEPSADAEPNPTCHPSSVKPTITTPKDATELHPGHFRYSLAIGDSVTAAALAKGGPLEYRQVSWSGGIGAADSFTMPYFVAQYSGSLVGPAKGNFQWDQLGPCCGKAPWWSEVEGENDQLNAALSGGMTSDWRLEVDHLTNLVTGKGFGKELFGGFPKWSKSQQEDYKKSWKVLTIFLGMNDVLTTTDSCSDDASVRAGVVSKFKNQMTSLLDYIVVDRDGIFQNVYINLGTLFMVSNVGIQNNKEGWCRFSGSTFLESEFQCMRQGGDIQHKGELVDNVTRQMNEVVFELAATYDQKRPDLGINLFQTPANQQIMHSDLRSPLDCFHPTAKAHRRLGTALWNSMLKPSRPTPFDDVERMPFCADADTKLVTYNRAGEALTANQVAPMVV